MTVTAEQLDIHRRVAAPSGADDCEPAGAPRLAGGVELLGEYKDSGYSRPPSLVRRADGQRP
jgi:hypothetical protein